LYHPIKTDSILVEAWPLGSIDEDYAHIPSVVTHQGDLYHYLLRGFWKMAG
jgi:hypothetical protein